MIQGRAGLLDVDPQPGFRSDSGGPAEAVAALRHAASLDSNLAVAWFNLGGAYCLLGKFDQARTRLARLTPLSPDLARQLDALIQSSQE